MKYKPHIVQNPDGEYSSKFHLAYSASFNENDDVETLLRKISATMSDSGIDKAEKRWYKHLPEYNASIETLSGYRVTTATVQVTREITTEDVMDCDLPEQNLNLKELPFEINAEEAIELLKDSNANHFTDERIIKVKTKGNVPLCESCRGTGRVPCHTCGGRGTVQCSYCEGTGLNPVTQRSQVSTEKYWRDGVLHEKYNYAERQSQCPECQGSGVQTCGHCGGQKFFPCADCERTGRKDGASTAATVSTMKESFDVNKESSLLLSNGDAISGNYDYWGENLFQESSPESIVFFQGINEITQLECDTEGDAFLIKYLNATLKNECAVDKKGEHNPAAIGIEVEKIPVVKKITVTYGGEEYEFYVIKNSFKDCAGYPEMSLIEDLFKTYKKKID